MAKAHPNPWNDDPHTWLEERVDEAVAELCYIADESTNEKERKSAQAVITLVRDAMENADKEKIVALFSDEMREDGYWRVYDQHGRPAPETLLVVPSYGELRRWHALMVQEAYGPGAPGTWRVTEDSTRNTRDNIMNSTWYVLGPENVLAITPEQVGGAVAAVGRKGSPWKKVTLKNLNSGFERVPDEHRHFDYDKLEFVVRSS